MVNYLLLLQTDYIWDYMENKLQNCPTRGCIRLGQGSESERWIQIVDFLFKW
jgi:hypothetical protein